MSKKGCAWGCGAVAVLIGVGVGVVFMVWGDLIQGARDLPAKESEARSLGLLIDLNEIGRKLEAKPEENAYLALKPAFEMCTEKDLSNKEVRLAMAVWNRHPGSLEQTLTALELPKYDSSKRWSDGMFMRFPDYSQLKVLAKGLASQVRDASSHSDLPRASKCLHGIVRIQRLVTQEPTLVSHLVGLAVVAIAQSAAWDAMAAHPGDLSWAQLAGELRQVSRDMDYAGFIRYEASSAHRVLKSSDPFGRDWLQVLGMDDDKASLPPIGPGSRDASIARLLEHYEPFYRDAFQATTVSQFEEAAGEFSRRLRSDRRPSAKAARIICDVWVQIGYADQKSIDCDDMLKEGAQILSLRKAIGSFPKERPQGGNPRLIYRPRANGFALYLPGPDKKDQGGPTTPGIRKAEGTDDIGICYVLKN
ncbi:MAG: hypothetical protein JSS66_08750 [Armatimonadetes bacterium]|nr:hypothetical protein [Armatimonadota bacterium]